MVVLQLGKDPVDVVNVGLSGEAHHELGYVQGHPKCGWNTNRGPKAKVCIERGVLLLCIIFSGLAVGQA